MTTPLTPTQVAERHSQLEQQVESIRANLLEARDTFDLHTEHWSSTNAAYVQLGVLLHLLEKAGKGLVVYNDPKFYDEMVPSLAKDDGGTHAANTLWQVYPE